MENKVLATVGQKEITQTDLDLVLRNFDPQTAGQFRSPAGQQRLLEELVNQELFYLDAAEKGVDKEEDFKAQLEKAKADLMKQYSISKLLNPVKATEDELLSYYNRNYSHFVNPESAKASHILVDSEEEANKVLDEIQSGATFEEAAKKYSKCPSSEQGGDLGYFSKGQMVPEFEQVTFELEKGQISKPVKTQFGYHIIKLADKKQEEAKTFDEVKSQLMQQVVSQKQQDLYFKKVDELKGKYKVVVNK